MKVELPFFKYKKHRKDDKNKSDKIIPFKFFFQISNGKNAENKKSNNFLNSF